MKRAATKYLPRREMKVSWILREDVYEGYEAPKGPCQNPKDLAKYLRPLADEPEEVFVVVFMDSRMAITGHKEISRGGVSSTVCGATQVFRAAVLSNCAAIIIAHNHPSGNVNPSTEDALATDRIKAAGMIMDIPVLDHLIVGVNPEGEYNFSSLKELGVF